MRFKYMQYGIAYFALFKTFTWDMMALNAFVSYGSIEKLTNMLQYIDYY